MSRAFVVLALSMLLGIQPVTTDLYLPALPALTQQLGASVAQAQRQRAISALAIQPQPGRRAAQRRRGP